MKQTFSMRLLLLSLFIAVSGMMLYSCKGQVKDSDLQMVVDDKAKAITGLGTASGTVKDGVVTLTGEVTDETAKVAFESSVKTIPGVKSVVNNLTVAPPPAPAPDPVTISPDAQLTTAVNEVVKAYNGVTAEVKEGIVTLTGTIKRADLQKLMPALMALQPKKVENKLTIK
ncbi:BON domain-containing protein [Paraflavitalea pollutisoli]|uniref:BON domain-containing protein n=1 Tax=Paraflavitalea pollutisoli TaxID=3034143 RepID=UPI0023ECA9BC|nr:BON domain-containing protein [Paraflavitalea sp. H1-2-19X]